VTDTQHHAGIVNLVKPAACDHQWERTRGVRNQTVSSRDHRARLDAPPDRGIPLDDGDASIDKRTNPGVCPGANDPPLRRVEQP
jgi:hypothetical protein